MFEFDIEIGNVWLRKQNTKLVPLGPDCFEATFPKPRSGPIPPPPPRVRFNGQEAVATKWIEWPHEEGGMVTIFFRLS